MSMGHRSVSLPLQLQLHSGSIGLQSNLAFLSRAAHICFQPAAADTASTLISLTESSSWHCLPAHGCPALLAVTKTPTSLIT